jgi:hypothetical protein
MKLFPAMLLLCVLVGCSPPRYVQNWTRLHEGMDRKDVRDSLGEPTLRVGPQRERVQTFEELAAANLFWGIAYKHEVWIYGPEGLHPLGNWENLLGPSDRAYVVRFDTDRNIDLWRAANETQWQGTGRLNDVTESEFAEDFNRIFCSRDAHAHVMVMKSLPELDPSLEKPDALSTQQNADGTLHLSWNGSATPAKYIVWLCGNADDPTTRASTAPTSQPTDGFPISTDRPELRIGPSDVPFSYFRVCVISDNHRGPISSARARPSSGTHR